jgi:hypothetical protein
MILSKGYGLKSEDDVLTKSLLVKFVAMSDQIELKLSSTSWLAPHHHPQVDF